MCRGVTRIFLDGLLKVLGGVYERLRRHLFVEHVEALKIVLVGLGINRATGRQERPLLGREPDLNLVGNSPRHLVLERQDVALVSFVAIGPNVTVRRRLDQLGIDSHSLPGAHHGAFHNCVDV
jgi:hypothetical protein